MRSQAPRLILVMRDDSGTTGQIRMTIRPTATAQAGLSALDDLRSLTAGLTGCVCIRQSLSFTQVEDPRGILAEGSDLHSIGIFIFTTQSGQNAVIEVPGLLDSLLVTSGPAAGIDIDQTQQAVIDFATELTNGLWCNPFGDPIAELDAAYLQIRP